MCLCISVSAMDGCRQNESLIQTNAGLFKLLSSPDDTDGLWIIVMFLSDSHSDGTHSLQSIHCWTLMQRHISPKPDEETTHDLSVSESTRNSEHRYFP